MAVEGGGLNQEVWWVSLHKAARWDTVLSFSYSNYKGMNRDERLCVPVDTKGHVSSSAHLTYENKTHTHCTIIVAMTRHCLESQRITTLKGQLLLGIFNTLLCVNYTFFHSWSDYHCHDFSGVIIIFRVDAPHTFSLTHTFVKPLNVAPPPQSHIHRYKSLLGFFGPGFE